MKKIGILGSGYIGQHLASTLKNDYEVSITTRQPTKCPLLSSLATHVIDLNKISLDDFISRQDILVVCVAPTHHDTYQSTYLDTAHFIHTHLSHFPHLQQIIYTGSTSIYGDQQGKWVDETTQPDPLNLHGALLLETENILMQCSATHRKVCLFRLGEIYGPQREIEARLKKMVGMCLPGTGENMTNMIHLDDCIRALCFAIAHQLSGVYNLCNDFHVKRQDFYNQLCEQHALPLFQWDPSRISMHGGNRKVSNTKLKAEGFTFLHSTY